MFLPPPTQVGNLSDIISQANQIRAQILQNKLSAIHNSMAQQTMPGQVSATNAQNDIISNTAANKANALNAAYQGQANTAVPSANAALKAAQIANQIKQYQANNPSMIAPGTPAAQAVVGTALQDKNPAAYSEYMRQQNVANNSANARANYQNSLSNTIGVRYATPLAKQQMTSSLQNKGFPATVATQIMTNPSAASGIVQSGESYSDWVKSGGMSQLPRTIQTQGMMGAPAYPLPSQAAGNNPAYLSPQSVAAVGISPAQVNQQNNLPAQTSYSQYSPARAVSNSGNVSNQALSQAGQTDSSIIKSTTTTDQQQRLEASSRAIPALKRMQELLPGASQYAGYLRTGSKLAQQLAQTKDPSFLAYKEYLQAQAAAEADTANAIGIRETDAGFKQFAPLFNINGWDSSPSTAKPLFDNMLSLVQRESLPNTQNLSQQSKYVQSAPLSSANPVSAPQAQMVNIKAPNGKTYSVPMSDVSEALREGGKRIG